MSPLTESTRLTLAKSFTWNESVWNPSMIQTALWLDAADAATVTTVSGAVSQWNDKSGNGRNATQSTAGERPLFLSTAVNGKPGLYVDTSTVRSLVCPNYIGANAGVFAVIQSVNPQGASGSFFQSRVSGVEGFRAAPSPNNQNTVTTQNAVTGYVNGTGGLFGASTASFYTYVSGESIIICYTRVETSVSTTWLICKDATENTTERMFSGGIGEIIVTPVTPSTLNRQRIEGYLAWKWGLTANLPAGHPYKTVGPTP
jgi:hypothetical protein